MDDSGQPGDAVPGGHNGTEEHGNGSRLHSWAPAAVESLASMPGSGSYGSNGSNGSAWSQADTGTDPLSSSWRPYERVAEVTPVGGSAIAAPSYPTSTPPYPYDSDLDEPDDREITTGFPITPVMRSAAVPLPPGHVSLADTTPWRGVPSVPSQFDPDALPQRVPAEPDVPALPEPVTVDDPRAEDPELARIATYLRHDDVDVERRDSFDVEAVLAAVQEVSGVRGAELRRNPGGVHTLRLDLADGADPALISRAVARLLNERMGLAAAVGAPGETRGLYRSGGIDPVRAARAESAFSALADTTRGEHGPDGGEHQGQRRLAPTAVRGQAPVEPRQPVDDLLGGPTVDLRSRQRFAVSPTSGADWPSAGQPQPAATTVRTHERPSHPLPPPAHQPHRVVIENVQVSTHGLDAAVEVRLIFGDQRAIGEANGPAVDGYVLRLAAVAAGAAIDELLVDQQGQRRGRCFVEQATVVPLGSCELAAVVLLLVYNGWVEQLAGSALVSGDPRQAIVRATLSAVNRRLESLLP